MQSLEGVQFRCSNLTSTPLTLAPRHPHPLHRYKVRLIVSRLKGVTIQVGKLQDNCGLPWEYIFGYSLSSLWLIGGFMISVQMFYHDL